MSQPKPKKDPERTPGVEIGDDVYFNHATGPAPGRVVAHGRHGCTLEHEGKPHKVTWDKVLGHKKRATQRYSILDEGEDGMIVQDAAGQRRYVTIPPEASEDPMVVKAMGDHGRILLFLKADDGAPTAPRAGLSRKQIVDKTGRKQTKWVRTNKDEGKKREAASPESKAGPGGASDKPDAKPGDSVEFKAGDFSGKGEIVGDPGADGAHVKDASGRVHQVRWSEITGKAKEDAPAQAEPGADGPLFSPDELASLPAKAVQPAQTWEELLAKGEEGLPLFREQLGKVAQAMGLQSGRKPDELTPEEWENDKGFVFVAPLKNAARAKEKVEADYGGEWPQLRDVVRATISVPNMANIKQALAHLREAGVEIAQRPKDRFANPTDEGYRDLMTVVKLPNGMLAELQIHVKSMTLAKEQGHEHYNVSRSLQAKHGEAEPTDAWPDEDHKQFYEALKAQKEIYDTAWSKASGDSVSNQEQAAEKPLQKSMTCSKMILLVRRT